VYNGLIVKKFSVRRREDAKRQVEAKVQTLILSRHPTVARLFETFQSVWSELCTVDDEYIEKKVNVVQMQVLHFIQVLRGAVHDKLLSLERR
jgi:hypothetical protein